GKLEHGPANITPNIHDAVTLVFKAKNHTVTQSSFEKPCEHLVDGDVQSFASGLYVLFL
ncbi:hypothetical protein BDZ89DRAFT_944661, partial [Hymenopellis radicata]